MALSEHVMDSDPSLTFEDVGLMNDAPPPLLVPLSGRLSRSCLLLSVTERMSRACCSPEDSSLAGASPYHSDTAAFTCPAAPLGRCVLD